LVVLPQQLPEACLPQCINMIHCQPCSCHCPRLTCRRVHCRPGHCTWQALCFGALLRVQRRISQVGSKVGGWGKSPAAALKRPLAAVHC
jgi:hypothetical protein